MNCEPCISTLTGTVLNLKPDEIIIDVCNYYNENIDLVLSKRRDLNLVTIRHKIFDLLYSNFDNKISLKVIGELLGNRDHSTVINGIKCVKTYCQVYADYRFEYQKLHMKIYGSLKYFKH